MRSRMRGDQCRILWAAVGVVLTVVIGSEPVFSPVLSGSSQGLLFGRQWAAISYNVDHVCPSRSGEPWFATLQALALITDPPRMRPEGLTFRNGLLYVSGEWGDTQNQIAVLSTNFWG